MSVAAGHVFPPALVPVLRKRCDSKGRCVEEATDEVLEHLLTTVFFAALETYEGERHAVKVVFLGKSHLTLVLPSGQEPGAVPIYSWRMLRFATPRPFEIPELVKLAVATTEDRTYVAVRLDDDEGLVVAGLAHEGQSLDDDRFLEIVSARPGSLSIRAGSDRLLEYARGAISTGRENAFLASGPIRAALEAAARAAGVEEDTMGEYLRAVRAIVRAMVSHGGGGILVVDADERPVVAESAPYQVVSDASLASLLRISRIIGRAPPDERSTPRYEALTFGRVLRNAFLTEAERTIEAFGALTAIDGAAVLNRELALVAFGAILPVASDVRVAEAMDVRATETQRVDLGSRGVRHRAGASYAAQHPGSVVFVASEDGGVACMLRDAENDVVTMWRLGAQVR